MSWADRPLAGLDFETSGVDPETDRIVTASVTRWQAGEVGRAWLWMSDVGGVDIPAAASQIHGITSAVARSAGRPAAAVVEEVIDVLAGLVSEGLPVVVMNASFDLTLLEREARRYGLRSLFGRSLPFVLDPWVLDKHVDPYRKGRRTLSHLCEHYGVRLANAHSADGDAQAACEVTWEITSRYPRLRERSLDDLHEDQARWAREQAEGLRAYYERTPGKELLAAGVRVDWPFVPEWRAEAAV